MNKKRPGRPVDENTQYKIRIHRNGGHEYAATKPFTVDKDGVKHYSYKHWGTVDEDLKFHPNRAFLYLSLEERSKLIFPKDWDMSELDELSSTRRRCRVSYQKDDVDKQYGATWLLDQVAECTGLKEDLRAVFGGNMEIVEDILTMAYYPFLDNLSYNQLSQWQKEVKAPSHHELSSTTITRLTHHITEKHRMDLFRRRAMRIGKDELCAVDSTSMSTYGFNLVDIRWGKNKEKLPLRQTLEIVVYSLTSHMPIFYREMPGNMPDCRTVELILKELEDAGFKNLILITDRGYESMKNLEAYIKKGQKVITSVKVSQGEVLQKIKELDMSGGYPAEMEISDDGEFYKQYDLQYAVGGNGDHVIEAQNYKLNLYFDIDRQAQKTKELLLAVKEQKAALEEIKESGIPVMDIEDTVKRFNLLKIKFSDTGNVDSYELNQEKFDNMKRIAGFFASKTVGVDFDPLQAKNNYGMRDEQEKCFALQKGPLGHKRLRTWSEGGKRGRMFIYFVGLILASYVRHVWKADDKLRNKYDSTEAVVAEMRTIRCIEHTGRMKFITPFVGAQIDICKAFGFEIPEQCAPTYVSKAKPLSRKRGRPAKPQVEHQE